MTDSQFEALQREMRQGFKALNDSVHDVHQAVNGIMVKLLHHTEVDEIRSRMKNPPKANGAHG